MNNKSDLAKAAEAEVAVDDKGNCSAKEIAACPPSPAEGV